MSMMFKARQIFNMRHILVFVCILCLYSCASMKQNKKEIKIKIYPSVKNDGLLGSTKLLLTEMVLSDSLMIEVVARNEIDTFISAIYSHDPESYYYHLFETDKINLEVFNNIKRNLPILNSFKESNKYDAETIFLVGRKKNNDCVVIVDNNNNNKLIDDSVYVFKDWFNENDSIGKNYHPYVLINNLFASLGEKRTPFQKGFKFQPLKRDSKENSTAQQIGLSLTFSDYFTGKFKFRGVQYKIAARNLAPKLRFDEKNTMFAIAEKKKPFTFQQKKDISDLHHLGSVVNLKRGAIQIEEIKDNGDSLVLKIVPKNKRENYIKDFDFKNVLTQEIINFKSLLGTNDYLVIDFWGSWCAPCIASFPELKELYKNLENKRISFLGVIYDKTDKLHLVIELLEKNNISWNQLFISQDESNTLVDKYKVLSYPTYFIVNKKGEIVYRDFGLSGFQRIKEYIKNKNP